MKITVEQYDKKISVETNHDDVTYSDFMSLIERLSYSLGYGGDTIKEWFNED
jgi:hypothetical protein